MKNIKHIIKEELNEDKFISLKTFQNRLCNEQKKKALSLYDKILNNSNLNWFLLKINKYKNVNISSDNFRTYIYWNNGAWNSGIWNNGQWESGIWKDGIWNGGHWNNGTWINGEWKKGLWGNGIWYNGIWNYGEWINGVWNSGYWLGGEWHRGKIWDKNLYKWVETTSNPAEYYKRNNIKQ